MLGRCCSAFPRLAPFSCSRSLPSPLSALAVLAPAPAFASPLRPLFSVSCPRRLLFSSLARVGRLLSLLLSSRLPRCSLLRLFPARLRSSGAPWLLSGLWLLLLLRCGFAGPVLLVRLGSCLLLPPLLAGRARALVRGLSARSRLGSVFLFSFSFRSVSSPRLLGARGLACSAARLPRAGSLLRLLVRLRSFSVWGFGPLFCSVSYFRRSTRNKNHHPTRSRSTSPSATAPPRAAAPTSRRDTGAPLSLLSCTARPTSPTTSQHAGHAGCFRASPARAA